MWVQGLLYYSIFEVFISDIVAVYFSLYLYENNCRLLMMQQINLILERIEEITQGLYGPPGSPGVGRPGKPGLPGPQGIPGESRNSI